LAPSQKGTLYVLLPTPPSQLPSILSPNHHLQPIAQLIIPKHHGAKLHDIPDDQLSEILAVTKKIAVAQNIQDYNILQNNGRIAHQVVDHVHFHLIPKPSEAEGLGIGWPTKEADKGELQKLLEEIRSKM
jgi:diadenosine tetraphosphate (Ap4A) HIT family hydrolase